jgi:signal transduction histidine kinase
MTVPIWLDSAHILQTIALAISIFNLITFLWLAFTVWLSGNRRSIIARVGVTGLCLSALFFFIHALLISGPPDQPTGLVPSNMLWYLIWLPALGVPYIWFVIGLYYAALMNEQWRARRPFLLIISGLLGCIVLLLLFVNRATFTFKNTLLLLGFNTVQGDLQSHVFSPIIWLPALFLGYVTFCAIGPWFTPARIIRLFRVLWRTLKGQQQNRSLGHNLTQAFWNDRFSIDQLKEPALSWRLARPTLLLAALLMVALTVSLGVLGIWSMVLWLQQGDHNTKHVPHMINQLPFNLQMLDIYATCSVALIVLLIGYSIVRHGILIERPLARRGFFEQWRGIVIVATTIAIFIALLSGVTRSSLGGMLLVTSIATGAYALFTWSSYTVHDRYVTLLTPLLHSTSVRHWLNTDMQKTELSMEALFTHLCQNVLEVRYANMYLLAGPVKRSFTYRWPIWDQQDKLAERLQASIQEALAARELPAESPHPRSLMSPQMRAYRVRLTLKGTPVLCWVLPLYDELGLVANLYLGPREDGAVFTNEDMDLALACGQRILNTLRDHEAMLTVAGLLRRRIVDVKLMGAQQRRVLHDEILPMLHLALLRLETLRSFTAYDQAGQDADQALGDVITSISGAHRQLASMMRAMTTSAPHRLERDGLMDAIHTMLTQDFQHAFDDVCWQVSEETAHQINELVPPAIAELIFAAVQEVLRNAARHARGTDIHRRLRLTLAASCDPHLEVTVTDDGVGIVSSSSTTGTSNGLLTHSALLAIAGGNLTVKGEAGKGVTVRIFLPSEALH